MMETVIFGGIEYEVKTVDRQVIFTHRGIGVTEMAFEKPADMADNNPTPGIWYLVHVLSEPFHSGIKIRADDIVQALAFCKQRYGDNFKEPTFVE